MFFDNIQPPREKKRLKFQIFATDIKNKEHILIKEPLSIYIAQNFVIPFNSYE